MDNIIGNNGEVQFANGQSNRDLRASSGNLHERTDSTDPLKALRRDSEELLEPFVGNARCDHCGRDSSGIRPRVQLDDAAGDQARRVGLLSLGWVWW